MPYPRTIAMLLFAATCAATPATAADCLSCHGDIAGQLKGNSHHIQGVSPAGRHCHACHWEATAAGDPDERFHQRDTARVDLVLWKNGARPAVYSAASTALTYSTAAVGTDKERASFAGITRHCLSCHNERTGSTATFAGDNNTPGSYAWDGTSIDDRYANRGTATWGKYSTPTTNRKMQVTKALSAHGNAVANAGGWSASGGYDSRIPDTRKGSSNVECFDCHNAHGSMAGGITSSYRTADGTSGGILKETKAGRGGYAMSYAPSTNSDQPGKNRYSTGAGLCFDCHETAMAGTTPWGYRSTFGASEPVMGYKDTHKFGPGVKGSTSRYASRQGRSDIVSSHLKGGVFLNHSALAPINGLCTPCHDPHGVSRTLGGGMPYAVPLLKGTWLSSPYREDAPPSAGAGKERQAAQGAGLTPAVSGSSRGPMSMQGMQYNVDRNTFGAEGRISEGEESFAGLCLKCHTRVKPAGETKSDRIHRSVKGWGENREHAFPCAKCHQAHNSGLPRLMQTNCFEEGPAGLRENIGLSWLPEKSGGEGSRSGGSGTQSAGEKKKPAGNLVGCHVRQFGRGGGAPPRQDRGQWREKSKW